VASEGAAGGPAWTALVTGGTGGMDRVIASGPIADGFDAAVAYADNSDLADTAVKEIESHGPIGKATASSLRRAVPM
jgi:NAD(P)-dependent dehydrogenase (short-subunit alcohol dehydrogenase family)